LLSAALAFLQILPALAMTQATPVAGDAGIPPVVWELVSFTLAEGEATEIEEPSRYTLQLLPDGMAAARFDCNQGSGSYTIEGDTIEFGPMRTTLVGCEPGSHDQSYMLLLQGEMSFSYDDDGHLILTSDAGSLTFRTALQGVVWEWQEFAGSDDSIVRPDDPERYTVEFLPDGKLALQVDCNRGFGSYTVDGPQIDLVMGGTTRMACPPGSLADRFLRDLEDASSHVFREGRLYLALPVDAGIMAFAARHMPPDEATPVAG
jgi:para-nitrobenzyl esterase